MKKITNLPGFIAAIVMIVLGSLVNFFVTNLLMSDISNIFYGFHDLYFITSLPGFIFALLWIFALLFMFRYFLRPNCRKALMKSWIIVAMVFALLGVIASVLTGTIGYHSFFKDYPFVGYTIGSLIFFVLLLVISIVGYILIAKKYPEDTEKRPITLKSSWHTIWLGLLMYFSMYRFGAFLWSPGFIQWRTFYFTWPFYIWLTLPMLLLLVILKDTFTGKKEGSKNDIILHSILLGLDVAFTLTVIILGKTNTQFVAAVSPTVAIERLATMPIDIILQTVIIFSFQIYFLVREIVRFNKSKK